MLIWTDDQAVAERAQGPSPASMELLGALRALHRAEVAARAAPGARASGDLLAAVH